MQIKLFKSRQVAKWFSFMVLLAGLSCQSERDIKPNTMARLSEKWWCDSKQLLPDQYFEASGVFRQRSGGKTELGKWTLSEDNKTILVTDVQIGTTKGNWSYVLQEVTDDQLKVIFYGGLNTFGLCQ